MSIPVTTIPVTIPVEIVRASQRPGGYVPQIDGVVVMMPPDGPFVACPICHQAMGWVKVRQRVVPGGLLVDYAHPQCLAA